MTLGSKILGLLLSAALAMTTFATGASATDHAFGAPAVSLATPDERPAGCHAHGGKTVPDSQLPHSRLPNLPLPHSPGPAPVRYQCCLTGHNATVVQASHSQQPPPECSRVTPRIETALTASFLDGFEVSMVFSANPPGTTPLRI